MEPRPAGNKNKSIVIGFIAVLAILIITGSISLVKNRSGDTATTQPATSTTASPAPAADPAPAPSPAAGAQPATAKFTDGSYTAEGTYRSPGGQEDITVTITVADDKITDSNTSQTANNPTSAKYQSYFKDNYKPLVVGQPLVSLSLSKVSGSSLTPLGFNDALEDIRSQATAQ